MLRILRLNVMELKLLYHNKIERSLLLDSNNRLDAEFYTNENVLAIAKALLGKILVTRLDEVFTAARIVETEAYNGITDKASHAFGDRRTNRTATMYGNGGLAYVYLCYGIHHLFNVVTNTTGIPHAVLIRGAEPVFGIDTMLQRTKKPALDNSLTRGPGNLSKALGITTALDKTSLTSPTLYIIDDGCTYAVDRILTSPRIGVDYAEEDAFLPYRFFIKDNPYVSGQAPKTKVRKNIITNP